ncbi:hypothetical protein LY76DRAFT_607831 [Colletotrichum caudatum]|nr:hypothetical protein LY76DRAFT_607831 [Colletotrichum caudatum]
MSGMRYNGNGCRLRLALARCIDSPGLQLLVLSVFWYWASLLVQGNPQGDMDKYFFYWRSAHVCGLHNATPSGVLGQPDMPGQAKGHSDERGMMGSAYRRYSAFLDAIQYTYAGDGECVIVVVVGGGGDGSGGSGSTDLAMGDDGLRTERGFSHPLFLWIHGWVSSCLWTFLKEKEPKAAADTVK